MNRQCKSQSFTAHSTCNFSPFHVRHQPTNILLLPAVMTNRGTAYIVYSSPDASEAAIAHMHEAQLDGAIIHVSIVLPRRKFSRTPPPARRGVPHFDSRRDAPQNSYRAPQPPSYGNRSLPSQYRSPPPRRGSPPRRYPYGGRGGGRDREQDTYRPRSRTRSRSPRSRTRSVRGRSRSYTRSRSRTPPRRRGGGGRGGRRDSPMRGGRGRRSPSYSSYSSYSKSRSRSRARYGGRR